MAQVRWYYLVGVAAVFGVIALVVAANERSSAKAENEVGAYSDAFRVLHGRPAFETVEADLTVPVILGVVAGIFLLAGLIGAMQSSNNPSVDVGAKP